MKIILTDIHDISSIQYERIWWNFNWAEFQWINGNFSFGFPSYSVHAVNELSIRRNKISYKASFCLSACLILRWVNLVYPCMHRIENLDSEIIMIYEKNAVNIDQNYFHKDLTDIHAILIIMTWKLRVFPNYENNIDRNIDPWERPKFSRHYEPIYSIYYIRVYTFRFCTP